MDEINLEKTRPLIKANLGIIDFSDNLAISESIKTVFKDKGSCEINVYSKEGSIPHFHIESTQDSRWKCCIELYRANYFSHGSKIGTLSNKDCEQLNEWLKLPNKRMKYMITNWEALCFLWNSLNEDKSKIPVVDIQPDYTRLNK